MPTPAARGPFRIERGVATFNSTEAAGSTLARRSAVPLLAGLRRRWVGAEPIIAAPRPEWPPALRRLWRIGLALLAVQFLAFCVWSSVLVHRVAMTTDFATYEQAFYLISHGHLDPFSSALGYPFWQDHGSFLLWPLAFLDWLWPHPTTLLWLQDAATVGAEAVAFLWVCELASIRVSKAPEHRAVWACVCLALILLVFNPWIVWAVSADFHPEPLATLWLVAAARDLFAGRRRAWIWIALALLTGDVGASYCAALGCSAVLAGQRWWRTGLAVACVGVLWMVLLGAIHATKGTVPGYYAPLILGHTGVVPTSTTSLAIVKAIIIHPGRAISALWANGLNVWADLSIAGLLGLAWPPLFVPMLLVLLEGALAHGPRFSAPGSQNLLVLILGAVGTIAICLKLAERRGPRRRLLFPALLLVLALNGAGWAAVWLPQVSKTWLRVTPAAAASLRQLAQRVGAEDQTVVQQGVSTGFAGRRFVHLIFGLPTTFQVSTRHVWFIFAPAQGIEAATPSDIYRTMTSLASVPHMRLALSANGIWAFEWTPTPGVRRLRLTAPSPPVIGAWTLAGAAGKSVREGAPRSWYAASNGKQGYVVSGDYWLVPAGPVSAKVSLAVSGMTNVELWDDTSGVLLQRKTLSETHGSTTVRLTGLVRTARASSVYSGWGPWHIKPKQPSANQILELRVWTPGHSDMVTVHSLSLQSQG